MYEDPNVIRIRLGSLPIYCEFRGHAVIRQIQVGIWHRLPCSLTQPIRFCLALVLSLFVLRKCPLGPRPLPVGGAKTLLEEGCVPSVTEKNTDGRCHADWLLVGPGAERGRELRPSPSPHVGPTGIPFIIEESSPSVSLRSCPPDAQRRRRREQRRGG